MTPEENRMIHNLCELEDDELSPWEANFVDSLSKVSADQPLTAKQQEKLKELYRREFK